MYVERRRVEPQHAQSWTSAIADAQRQIEHSREYIARAVDTIKELHDMIVVWIEKGADPAVEPQRTRVEIKSRAGKLVVTASRAWNPAAVWKKVEIAKPDAPGVYPLLAAALNALGDVA